MEVPLDETNLEASGLNEEQVTQIAETLGYFAKMMMDSTEKRKKKNARFDKKSAKVDQKRAKLDKIRARFGRKNAKVDQKSARFGQKSARVGSQRPKDTVC